jgi:hypothetical protein
MLSFAFEAFIRQSHYEGVFAHGGARSGRKEAVGFTRLS